MIKGFRGFAKAAAVSTTVLATTLALGSAHASEAAGWSYAQGSLGSPLKLELGLGVSVLNGEWGALGIEGRAAANLSPLSASHFGLDAVFRKALGKDFALYASAGYELARVNPLGGRSNLGVGASFSLGSFGVRGGYQLSGTESRFTLGLEVVAKVGGDAAQSAGEDFINW